MHCNSFTSDFFNCIISFRKVISTKKVAKRLDVNILPFLSHPQYISTGKKKKKFSISLNLDFKK